MTYGLRVYGPSGQTWFDSNLAQAGVPVDYFIVPGATFDITGWHAGTYSQSYPGYSNFTLKALYLSGMFMESTVTSGPGVSNPSVSFTNYGVDAAAVLIVATAS